MPSRDPSHQELPQALLEKLMAEGGRNASKTAAPLVLRALNESARKALECAGAGWLPQSDVTVRPGNGAAMRLELVGFKRIEVTVNVDALVKQGLQLAVAETAAPPLEIAKGVVQAMVSLWAGHYDYCPYDTWRHDRLCEAAAEGGFGTVRVSTEQWRLATTVACFFERNIVTRILTGRDGVAFTRGIVHEHHLNKRWPNLLTDLLFRGQSLLAPQAWKDILHQHPVPEDPMTDGLLPEVLSLVFGVRLRRVRGKLRMRSAPGGEPRQREWADRVYRLAELLIPYLEGSSRHRGEPSSHPFGMRQPPTDSAYSATQGSAPGHGSRGDSAPSGSVPCGGGQLPDDSSPRVRQLDFETLDRYYSERAAALPVETDAPEQSRRQDPDLITVGFLASERADLRALVSGPIDWFGLRVKLADGKRKIVPRRRTEPLEEPRGGDGPAGVGPPHLLLVVDSSGSMKFNASGSNPAARGKYDVVLAACYGIFAHIQRSGFDDHVQVACINFSRNSIESGWHTFQDIAHVKKVLFQYQGGGTQLNPQAVHRAFTSRSADFLTVMITDGCLGNVPAATAALKRTVQAGCDLISLHVGPPNAFTEAIRALGCSVHVLQTADELAGLSLRIARDTYKRSPS